MLIFIENDIFTVYTSLKEVELNFKFFLVQKFLSKHFLANFCLFFQQKFNCSCNQ